MYQITILEKYAETSGTGKETDDGDQPMAVSLSPVFSAAAFSGILLLYNEEPAKVHTP